MGNKTRFIEITVGFFIILGVLALVGLAFKVSGLTSFSQRGYYTVYAEFDNVGDLKTRAPVRIAGVKVGEVTNITLDPSSFRARVMMSIDSKDGKIPNDTSASILTEGILGSNYIGLNPGFEEKYLKNGSMITNTHPAIILENLIGQLIFNVKDKK